MKKIIILTMLALSLSFNVNAQVNPHTLGVRLGGGSYSGGELSYQKGIGGANRLEFDLGFGASKNHNRSYLAIIYHWDWNIVDALNWYIGPGASIGLYSYDHYASYFNIAVGGQIGIEYDFKKKNVPILISIDTRPMWDLLGDHPGLGWGGSFSVRYVF